jgi:hypothetical protein
MANGVGICPRGVVYKDSRGRERRRKEEKEAGKERIKAHINRGEVERNYSPTLHEIF